MLNTLILFVVRDLYLKGEEQRKEILFKINELQAMVKADMHFELVDDIPPDIVLEDVLQQ